MLNKLGLSFTLLFLSVNSFAGTVAGDGGSPLTHFLEASRRTFIQVIKQYQFTKETNKSTEGFCQWGESTQEKEGYCSLFFEQGAAAIAELSRGPRRPEFTLKEDVIYVKGTDGLPMKVAARLTPNRDMIEFHSSTISTYSPASLLFLLSHEMSHLINFEGKTITDNDRIGPFIIGRELLDLFASSIVNWAKKFGFIGNSFGLRDYFECETLLFGKKTSILKLSSRRNFLNLNRKSPISFENYQAGFGLSPDDPEIAIPINDDEKLAFRLTIQEKDGCRNKALGDSTSKVQIIRYVNSSEKKSEEILSEKIYNANPICDSRDEWFALTYREFGFRCQYKSSQATGREWD